MKIKLELNYCDSGVFLNFWDFQHGNDICAKLCGLNLVDIDGEIITLDEFFERVKLANNYA